MLAHPARPRGSSPRRPRPRDIGLVRAQLDAVAPTFAPRPAARPRASLERWADFDARIGIVDRRPDVGAAFDFSMAR